MSVFRNKRTVLFIVFVVLLAISLPGCREANIYDNNGNMSGESEKKPVEMKIVLGYAEEMPSKDNPVIQELNRLANANIIVEWTPMVSYNDKFNVLMASNNMPDVVLVPDVKNTTFLYAVNAGMFWELTDRIQNFSELREINPILLKNASVNGKLYMLPRERELKRKMVVYRADWAKEAGLGPPDTIEGIYNMAKAFAKGDFDGNSEIDTIGFALGTVNNEIDCFDALVVAFGGFNRWGIKDNKIVPSFMTEEYLETMKWLRKMYRENLINRDFAITKTTQIVPDLVDKEKTGLWLAYRLPTLSDPVLKAKQEQDPSVKREDVYGYAFLKDVTGNERIAAETGISGGFAFPKKSVKTEERLNELLGVFNVIQSREGQILINNGIEGVHFELVEGKYAKAIDPEVFNREVSPIGQLGTGGTKAYIIADDEISIRLNMDRRTYNNMVFDVTATLFSSSYSSNYTTLQKIISDAQFKFIMGEIDEDEWNKAIEEWLKAGGEAAIDEFTNAYYGKVN